MVSIPAQEVAKEVLENVRKGKRPNLGKIIKSKGYAETTSTVPTQVTNTKSYQDVIRPFVEQLEQERQRAIRALSNKNLDEERYKDLVDAIDKLTKNHQLLSGGATENVKVSGVEISVRKND